MNGNQRLFSNISLGLSGAAVLGALGYWFIRREFDLTFQILAGLIVVGFALFVYFDPDRARHLFSGRQARYGSNAFVLLAAFIGIVVIANYIVYQNAQEWGLRWDLTEDQERTLADETLATLQEVAVLDTSIAVEGYFTGQNANRERAEALLEDYEFNAEGSLTFEFIDPNLNPVAAQDAGITQDGTLIFSLGEREQRVTSISEQAFTSAIVQLLSPNDKAIYFLIGHGEYTVDQAGADTLNQLRTALEGKNYIVSSLNLLVTSEIPEDATVVVIAGPVQPVTEAEVALLQDFVSAGGSLIVAEDPLAQTEFASSADPVNDYLTEFWGITLGDDLVIEPQVIQTLGGLFAASVSYASQEITSDLAQRQMSSVFPVARSVSVTNSDLPEVVQTELILSSEQSWAETNIESINEGTPAADEEDLAGPVSLAVAAENTVSGSRVVVFGDSEFLSDSAISQFGNRTLILNAIDWASRQESLITLSPRETTQRFITPPTQNTINLLALATICLIPGIVLVSGIAVWVARRRST